MSELSLVVKGFSTVCNGSDAPSFGPFLRPENVSPAFMNTVINLGELGIFYF